MAIKYNQYTVGKEGLYYFYRFIILEWELDWKNKKFNSNKGNLKKFSFENRIEIKSFASVGELESQIKLKYATELKSSVGFFWFVRKESKPKDTLQYLRNCFAHGNYKKIRNNNLDCLEIKNIDKNRTKAIGFLPLYQLKKLIKAASIDQI